MARLILLDAGPLGLASGPNGKPGGDACRDWLRELVSSGTRIVVPEVADFEVRRELLQIRAVAGIRRLDVLKNRYAYLPITTAAMLRAAEFWAEIRRGPGAAPTAPRDSLDGDAVLAGQAATAGAPGDVVVVATDNLRHLGRFSGITAAEWRTLV